MYIGGESYYLVDISQNGQYDVLCNPRTQITTAIQLEGDYYLIDSNGDGTWDHSYNIQDGSVSTYEEETILPIVIWILLILAVFIIIILIYHKYKPVFKKLKKPRLKPVRLDKDTKTMITETRSLLECIQHDVSVYMDKLEQLEGKIEVPIAEPKEEHVTAKIPPEKELIPEKIKTEELTVEDIEKRVDDLLSQIKTKKEENN